MSCVIFWLTAIFFCLFDFGNVIVSNIADIVVYIVIYYRNVKTSCFNLLFLKTILPFLLFLI